MAAPVFVQDPDFIDVRKESWYIPLLQSVTDKINAIASKKSFQREGGEDRIADFDLELM